MSIRKILFCATMLATMSAPAFADSDIIVTTAPPAPHTDVVHEDRAGYAWAPGYWKWEDNHHVWVEGHYIEAHNTGHYVPEQWEKVDDTHWRFHNGHWED